MSCKACRRCHYKCRALSSDGQLPRCGRCVRARRDCVREPPRQFYQVSRHGVERSFSSSQTWMSLPPKGVVNFVNVAEPSGAGSSADSASPGQGGKDTHMNMTAAPTFFAQEATGSTPAGENPASSSMSSLSASPPPIPVSTSRAQAKPTSRDVPLHLSGGNVQSVFQTDQSILEDGTTIDAGTHLPLPVRRIYLNPPTWPLQDPEEATLLQHFINQVSLFFDFCDKERHFATVVPQRVRTCGALLSAVFALSARHLSRISNFDPTVADRHYNDFPDIRYTTEDQVIASQFFSLARIVLDRNDPAHRITMLAVAEKARQRVWIMCGVGLSNPSSPAAILIACMGIALCGDCFDDHRDREKLCFVLEFTEDTRGWPTASIAKTLKQIWNNAS